MPFSSRLTWRPAARHAWYPLTRVASGIREEISRTFAQVSPCSRAAARRYLAQSPAERICPAVSCRRVRSAAIRCSRSSSWPGRLRVLAFWSGPSPAAASSRVRLAVLACLQAADGCQPAEPVIGDFVTFAAQLLGQRDLAQARAGVPGAGDDAPGGCDELGVTVAGVRIILQPAAFPVLPRQP